LIVIFNIYPRELRILKQMGSLKDYGESIINIDGDLRPYLNGLGGIITDYMEALKLEWAETPNEAFIRKRRPESILGEFLRLVEDG